MGKLFRIAPNPNSVEARRNSHLLDDAAKGLVASYCPPRATRKLSLGY